MVRGAPAHPDERVPEQRALEEDRIDLRERERRNGAGRESSRLLDLVRGGHARGFRPDGTRDLLGIRSAVTRYEHDQWPIPAYEDEGLHDLIESTSHRPSSVRRRRRSLGELFDPGLGTGVAQEVGDPSDGLRRGRYHAENRIGSRVRHQIAR